MAPTPSLNTYAPGTWAQVASAVMWAAHTLTPGGMFGAKVARGPLIVWAREGGEGEDLPHLGPPQPSPLEVAAARLNMAPHLRAFVRAAHGKVRHSVRWRTSAYVLWARKTYGELREWSIKYNPDGFTAKVSRRLWRLIFEKEKAGDRAYRKDLSLRHNFRTACQYFASGRGMFSSFVWRLLRTFAGEFNVLALFSGAGVWCREAEGGATPRPLYARPRPPTAPLAPPLA